MRNSFVFDVSERTDFIKKMILYSKNFSHSCILHSNKSNSDVPKKYYQFDVICAFDSIEFLESSNKSLLKLQALHKNRKDWIFGYMSYDLKNELHLTKSENKDLFNNKNIGFFIPRHVLIIKNNNLIVESVDNKKIVQKLINTISCYSIDIKEIQKIKFKYRISKSKYLEKIVKIKAHIQRGDIYEMNFCQEFFKENINLSPQDLFLKFNNITNSPFSTLLNINDFSVISSSPERYFMKNYDTVISQPIKGTSKRSSDTKIDSLLIKKLKNNQKDISENTMIVDLVRNDLSVTAKKGTVKVDKLCGVYTFSHVHQMISTISSELKKGYDFSDIIKTTFPMGSMTGAPKLKAMELIEKYEDFKRDVYSGSVGYITPEGNCDFNVIIRSLLYNSKKKYLSFSVGGAIVSNSDAIKEYEECLIKARPIFELFE